MIGYRGVRASKFWGEEFVLLPAVCFVLCFEDGPSTCKGAEVSRKQIVCANLESGTAASRHRVLYAFGECKSDDLSYCAWRIMR